MGLNEECIFCTDVVPHNSHSRVYTTCRHGPFHRACILRWFNESNVKTCPNCRAPIYIRDYQTCCQKFLLAFKKLKKIFRFFINAVTFLCKFVLHLLFKNRTFCAVLDAVIFTFIFLMVALMAKIGMVYDLDAVLMVSLITLKIIGILTKYVWAYDVAQAGVELRLRMHPCNLIWLYNLESLIELVILSLHFYMYMDWLLMQLRVE